MAASRLAILIQAAAYLSSMVERVVDIEVDLSCSTSNCRSRMVVRPPDDEQRGVPGSDRAVG